MRPPLSGQVVTAIAPHAAPPAAARRRRAAWLAVTALALGLGTGLALRTSDAPSPATPLPVAGRPALVELGSTKCASCAAMQPVLAVLRTAGDGRLDVRVIDVFQQREAIRQWNVRAIPTQVFLDRQGRELERHVGFISGDDIHRTFARHGIAFDRPGASLGQ